MITLNPTESSNESDVEQKFIYQFLSDAGYLDYPSPLIKTKQFLVPLRSDKKFDIGGGYYPDYLIWMSGYPVMIVEAKHPDLPEGEVGRFLRLLYTHLFSERRNMARVLEALAGRDVRKALDMFASIVTSGHISTEAITSNTIGAGEVRIADYHVIRVLMRGDYRFFSDVSGVVSNIFHFDPDWEGADNFICIEALYFLAMSRKMQGEIGLEGYFSVARVADELERIGYPRSAALEAIQWLLRKELIIADHYSFVDVRESDCVKIQASGFMHLRVLCERIEYLYGILTVTQISDMTTAIALADSINRESQRGYCTRRDQVSAVEKFSTYLKYEYARNRERNPFNDSDRSGAAYVIRLIENELRRAQTPQSLGRGPQNELDLQ